MTTRTEISLEANGNSVMYAWFSQAVTRGGPRLLLVQAVIALTAAGCSLAELPNPPTPMPTAAPALSVTPTGQVTEGAPATSTASDPSTPTTTAQPPTRPPQERAPLPAADSSGELVISWIEMVDTQAGWAVGMLGDTIERVLHTDDGGRTWAEVSPPALTTLADGSSRLVLHVGDSEEAWSIRYEPADAGPPQGSQTALVWRTADSGANWEASETMSLPFVGSRGDPPYLRFTGGDAGWLMARAGGAGMHRYPVSMLRSEDRGATWHVTEDPREGTALQSCHKSGFAVGPSGVGLITLDSCPVTGAEVRFTLDGAQTWTSALLPPPQAAPDLFENAGCEAHSPTILERESWRVAVTCVPFEGDEEVGYLYTTEDAGGSWSARSYPGGAVEFMSPDRVWALSREIHFSSNAGRSWRQRKQVFWQGQFSFVSEEEGWAVARQDGEIALVHTDDGGRSWEIIEPDWLPGQ